MGQVARMEELWSWIAEGVPDGCVPLRMADRGIGPAPDLIRVGVAPGWQYRVRGQGQTCFQLPKGRRVARHGLVTPGGRWTAQGRVFKNAGGVSMIAPVLWEAPHQHPGCLVTHCPASTGRLYARRSWQAASFRDLKSAGWQGQAARSFSPAHANWLVLVLRLASAFVLSLGPLAFEEPPVAAQILDKHASVFCQALRLWAAYLGHVPICLIALPQTSFVFLDPLSLNSFGP